MNKTHVNSKSSLCVVLKDIRAFVNMKDNLTGFVQCFVCFPFQGRVTLPWLL